MSVLKFAKNFDCTFCKYVNVPTHIQNRVMLGNSWYNFDAITTRICYNIFVGKQFIKPYTENMWKNIINLDLHTADWKNIYACNSKFLPKKLSEFKYKILMNFLSCGEKLNQWNIKVSNYCDVCGETESIIHLLYICPRVKNIWSMIGIKMKLNFRLKHIIFGFWMNSENQYVRNLIIVIISYSIHSAWSKCKYENKNYRNINISVNIKRNLKYYNELYCLLLDRRKSTCFDKTVKAILEVL